MSGVDLSAVSPARPLERAFPQPLLLLLISPDCHHTRMTHELLVRRQDQVGAQRA